MIPYKQLSLAEIFQKCKEKFSINQFKDSYCVAGRKTQNERTLHADLLISGIAQLLTVVLADKIHQHQYIRSLKPLIA